MTLEEAGARYAEARRSWAETFLFYYNQPSGKKPRTVAEAQAMADVAVNVTQAMVDWEVAKLHASQSYSTTASGEPTG